MHGLHKFSKFRGHQSLSHFALRSWAHKHIYIQKYVLRLLQNWPPAQLSTLTYAIITARRYLRKKQRDEVYASYFSHVRPAAVAAAASVAKRVMT